MRARILVAIPWLAAVPVLNGCAPHVQLAVAPDIQSATWSIQPGAGADGIGVAQAPLDWAAFGSPRLDALLAQVRAANTDIAIANARIAQAAADLRIAKSANGPTLEAFSRAESNARGGSGDNAFRDSYVAGDLDLTYTLDLSGRLKASKKAAFARYRAAGYEAQATRLTIEAAAATAYIEYAALCDRIKIADQALANAREFGRTLNLRAEAGIVSQVDAGIQAAETNDIAVNLSRCARRDRAPFRRSQSLQAKRDRCSTLSPPLLPISRCRSSGQTSRPHLSPGGPTCWRQQPASRLQTVMSIAHAQPFCPTSSFRPALSSIARWAAES